MQNAFGRTRFSHHANFHTTVLGRDVFQFRRYTHSHTILYKQTHLYVQTQIPLYNPLSTNPSAEASALREQNSLCCVLLCIAATDKIRAKCIFALILRVSGRSICCHQLKRERLCANVSHGWQYMDRATAGGTHVVRCWNSFQRERKRNTPKWCICEINFETQYNSIFTLTPLNLVCQKQQMHVTCDVCPIWAVTDLKSSLMINRVLVNP